MRAEIWNKSKWIEETKKKKLVEYYTKILQKCGFNILQYIEHNFEPQGFTGLWLLGESHFAVHTFPEFGKTYIELSSCNKEYFIKFLNLNEL